MSLFRQLWLAVIAITLIVFTGSFLVSMVTASHYLEDQLRIKNNDNAAALALSMTQLEKDPVTIELQVAAIFDSGQYALIRVRDPEGQILIEKTSPPNDEGVPHWFTHLFPIESSMGVAQISSGWSQFGTIELISHTQFAYRELWDGAQHLLLWFIVGGIMTELLGMQILFRVKRPLDAVVAQARSISNRHFVQIEVPATTELKSLAQAMNSMVASVKAMFDEEARRLEELRRDATLDSLTGLFNRAHFMNQLDCMLNDDDTPRQGSLIMLRLADLAGINRRYGHQHTDLVLRRIGHGLSKLAEEHPRATAARLNGSDFALLLPGERDPDPSNRKLLELLQNLETEQLIQAPQIGYLGSAVYHHGEVRATLLARIDAAIAAAEGDGSIACRHAQDEPLQCASNNTDWRNLIEHALATEGMRLAEFPVRKSDGSLLHLECPLRLQNANNGEWLVAGTFIPVAARLGMTCELDLAATRLALAELSAGAPAIAVNLSGDSILNIVFCQQLLKLISSQRELAPRLWLEVAEGGVFRHFEAFAAFAQLIRPQGCRLGIEHFGRQFGEINRLHEIGLDYLKVDGSFIRGIDTQSSNQTFLKGLCGIAHKIGLTVIAEGVSSSAELAILPELGFDGATGPALPAS